MGSKSIGRIMVNARKFDLSRDYDILFDWWYAHNSFPPKPEHLSTTGIVVEVEDKPVCAGFLYKTDSKICILEFVVCDPGAAKKARDQGLSHLIEEVKIWAVKEGYTLIYNSSKFGKFINRLQDAGFVIVDTDMKHCFYEVNNG